MQRFLPRLEVLKNAAKQVEEKQALNSNSVGTTNSPTFSNSGFGNILSKAKEQARLGQINQQTQPVQAQPTIMVEPQQVESFVQPSYAQMPNFGVQQGYAPVNYSAPGTLGNMMQYTPNFAQEQNQTMANMQTGNQTLGGMPSQVLTGLPNMQGRLFGEAAGTPKQLLGNTFTGQRAFPIEGDTFENNQNRPQMSVQDFMANLYKFRR